MPRRSTATTFACLPACTRGYRVPHVSLLALGCVAVPFCFLSLADVIAALVVIRILLQFLVQAIGAIVLRIEQPELPRPFRMWFYPLPALLASAGFLFILISRKHFLKRDTLCRGDPGHGAGDLYGPRLAGPGVAIWGRGWRRSIGVSGN